MEKAREIRVKADEEFAIEKVREIPVMRGVYADAWFACCPGQTREARAASHRRAVREEAEGRGGRAEDVRPPSSLPTFSCLPALSAQSTLTNKSRLRLLQQREEHLQDLFGSARELVNVLAQDEARYVQFLEGVIVQGLLRLLEPEVTVHAREKDVEIARRAGEGAAKQYNEISGRTVTVTVEGTLSKDL